MHPHPFPPFLIITTCFMILIIHVPTCLSMDDEQYQNCSKTFDCANIKDIGYPFWGQNRSQSCGHPGFELNCSGDAPQITMDNMVYRILSIDNTSYSLTVVRDDYWTDYCPQYLINTTLDFSLFTYDSTAQNLTLFYGCTVSNITGQFTCNINNTNSICYYTTRNLAITNSTLTSTFGICSDNVIVPVALSAAQTIENNPAAANLSTALRGGFGVKWAANNALCLECAVSGGQCGHDITSVEFICYCPDGPSATKCGGEERSTSNLIQSILGLPAVKERVGNKSSTRRGTLFLVTKDCPIRRRILYDWENRRLARRESMIEFKYDTEDEDYK